MVNMIGFTDDDMQNEIDEDNMRDVLLVMELTKNPLTHMHGIFEQVFQPLLHNEQNSK
jgi:hypothetical protein